jgi:NhaP-type Na+/H+ or K+/H+ antiporter
MNQIESLIFLPLLLNAAALTSSQLDLGSHLRPIMLLAIDLVLATTLVAAAHFVIGLRVRCPSSSVPSSR